MTAAAQAEQPESLKDLVFADLYLGDTDWIYKKPGDQRPFDLPAHLREEATQLLAMCKVLEEKKGASFALQAFEIRFRGELMPTTNGKVYVLRRLPEVVPDLQRLRLPLGIVRRLTLPGTTGLILICGATSSGKSTTAAAVVDARLREQGGVCVTIEDPPEMPLAGKRGLGVCYQVEVENGDFKTPCRSMLRWAPTMIFIGEIRDTDSAIEAVRASLNGHLVIGTLHSDNVISGIERLQSMLGGAVTPEEGASMLSSGLLAVMHQTMRRTQTSSHVQAQWLFFYGREGEAPRTNVRDRNFKMLLSHIEAQERRMQRNIDDDIAPFVERVKR